MWTLPVRLGSAFQGGAGIGFLIVLFTALTVAAAVVHWPRVIPGPVTVLERRLARLPGWARVALRWSGPLSAVVALTATFGLLLELRTPQDAYLRSSVLEQGADPSGQRGLRNLGCVVDSVLESVKDEPDKGVENYTRTLRAALVRKLTGWQTLWGCSGPRAKSNAPRWAQESVEMSVVDYVLQSHMADHVFVEHAPPSGHVDVWGVLRDAYTTDPAQQAPNRPPPSGFCEGRSISAGSRVVRCAESESVWLQRLSEISCTDDGSPIRFHALFRVAAKRAQAASQGGFTCNDVARETVLQQAWVVPDRSGGESQVSVSNLSTDGIGAAGAALTGQLIQCDFKAGPRPPSSSGLLRFGGLEHRYACGDSDVAYQLGASELRSSVEWALKNDRFKNELALLGLTPPKETGTNVPVELGQSGIVLATDEAAAAPCRERLQKSADGSSNELVDPLYGRSPFSWTNIAVPKKVAPRADPSWTPVVTYGEGGAAFVEFMTQGEDKRPMCVVVHLQDADKRLLGKAQWEPATLLAMVRTMIWAGNCLTRGSCTIDRLADYDDQPTEPRPLLSLQDHRAISAKRRLVYDLLWSVLLLAYLAALASFRLVSLANKPQGPTSRSI